MAIANETTLGTIVLTGDLAGGNNATMPQLVPTGVKAGEYKAPAVTVDAKGRLLFARNLSHADVSCADVGECGIVKVGNNLTATTVSGRTVLSLKKASATEYGVVKIGAGFGKACCEIFADYVEATETTLGVVTVPNSGNLAIDGAGNLSVPIATDSTIGVFKATGGNGLALVGGILSYTPPTTTTSVKGFVQIGSGFTAASGILSIPNATSSVAGAFRFDSSFGFTGTSYSYTTAATAGAIGFVKIGTGLGVDAEGVLYRGQGQASTSTKGAVQITAGNGLAVASGVITYAQATATTSSMGAMQAGTSVNISSGVISLPEANGTATKGTLAAAAGGKLVITNGIISFGPSVLQKDVPNTFTKAQAVSKVAVTYASTVNLDLTAGNVFDMTLTGNPVVATPATLISGGHYILILRQDATGGRQPTFSSAWKFMDVDAWLDGPIATTPNAINVISFMVIDSQIIAQVERDFS